jgi:glycosyltransferase involved in cell wall biosynthesis
LGYRDDVHEVFAASDVVAMSSMDEGLPLSLLEAMACGAIPVSTNVAEIPSIVDGVGLVVPKKDPEALAAALLRVADLDLETRRSLSVGAVEKVRREYNVTSMSESYAKLVRSAVVGKE